MSKPTITFNVTVRERVGTGGSRAVRREGLVPAVLYGGDEAPVPIALKRGEVQKAIETGQFLSSTATLVYKGDSQLVIPQGIQMHPVTDQPMHVDLFRVTAKQLIKVEVLMNFVGEEECPGLKKGGTLNVVRFTIELLVPAGNIPDSIEADISELEIGDNIKLSNVKLPDDAQATITDRDFTIATIAGRTAEIVEDEVETDAEAAEGEEAADGDAKEEDGDKADS